MSASQGSLRDPRRIVEFAVCSAHGSDAIYKATGEKLDTLTEILKTTYADQLEEEIQRVEEECTQAC